MLPSQNLIPITLSFPFRGIDTNTPSTMLADGHSPLMTNVELTKDHILQKRTGYTALASVIDPGETIQRIEEFIDEVGIRHTLAFTTKHQWLYDESTSTASWRDISYSTALTGTEEDYIDFVVGYDATGKYCIITNGVDKPLWWNGKTVTFEQLPIDLPGFVTCKTLAVFQSRLFLGGLFCPFHLCACRLCLLLAGVQRKGGSFCGLLIYDDGPNGRLSRPFLYHPLQIEVAGYLLGSDHPLGGKCL